MLSVDRDLRGPFTDERFCHQFILGPAYVDKLVGWQQIEIGESLKLTLHPEVGAQRVANATRSLTIIGYILDPQNPSADDAAVAHTLFEGFRNLESLIASTSRYGGRWLILARAAGQQLLFGDALGLRQAFFSTPEHAGGLWVASQPGLLAWHLNLHISQAAARFIASYEFRSQPEYRWPGAATAFGEINHLLPNHCLDLSSAQQRRYWPRNGLEAVTLAAGVERVSGLLTGLMNAASRRFDLVLGMTAGLDSRIVLAASRALKDDISACTVRQKTMPDTHQDLTVAARLMGRLGIDHTVIEALPTMSGAFSRSFKENYFLAHDHYGTDVEAILKHYSRTKAVATGSGAEVAREAFRTKIDATKRVYSAEDLARLQKMGSDSFALTHLQHWLDSIEDLHNVHMLDLYSWEQSHGNWLAGTQAEFDLAWQETVTPFNCRDVLQTLLSVDEKYRRSPDHALFNALIEGMWPELLAEPINPHNRRRRGRLRKLAGPLRRVLKR